MTNEQRQHNGAKPVFSINGVRKTKKIKVDRDLRVFSKINSKWTTDLNSACRTIK